MQQIDVCYVYRVQATPSSDSTYIVPVHRDEIYYNLYYSKCEICAQCTDSTLNPDTADDACMVSQGNFRQMVRLDSYPHAASDLAFREFPSGFRSATQRVPDAGQKVSIAEDLLIGWIS